MDSDHPKETVFVSPITVSPDYPIVAANICAALLLAIGVIMVLAGFTRPDPMIGFSGFIAVSAASMLWLVARGVVLLNKILASLSQR